MPAAKPPTFRPTAVTLWPADPGALPLIERHEVTRVGDVLEWSGFAGMVDVPVDFAFREVLDADLSDDGVLAFIDLWGAPSRIGAHSLDLLPVTERGALVAASDSTWSLAIQRHHLRALRACVRHWLAHVEGHDTRDAWVAEGFQRAHNESLPWEWWLQYVNAGVASFQMHVIATYTDDHQTAGLGALPIPTPYSVAMRQLAQIASDGEQIRHCANDNCRKPFTRQRGRAQYVPRERGVIYCSSLCARAQAERQRRARRAAERSDQR